jgi:RNA polymerase sigma-70 factor (ECF subfamily)
VASNETARLLDRVHAGSDEAMNELYRRCAGKLLPLIRLRMGPALRADVESRDVLQAVLLKSFQDLRRGTAPASLMAWLSAIAQNEIRDRIDYLRRARRDVARRAPLDEAEAVPAPVRQALSQVILGEQAERVERALEALPEAQREIILLRHLEELTFPEIAVRLGKSADACRMQLARAMAVLTIALHGSSDVG